eukprot:CAMPEP_0170483376 /NCGR_PEP_ID=MMETSP0208-20121228/3068_1 /TAXON_ID=197538 /ORGANISM="Strombidium inclinatum, Strain S3" /LENGTH=233 /DNA_ID=CAMNT_0010756389 /DNA_START=1191 /DNA_END=1892 /DNA_ORIENTATION=+
MRSFGSELIVEESRIVGEPTLAGRYIKDVPTASILNRNGVPEGRVVVLLEIIVNLARAAAVQLIVTAYQDLSVGLHNFAAVVVVSGCRHGGLASEFETEQSRWDVMVFNAVCQEGFLYVSLAAEVGHFEARFFAGEWVLRGLARFAAVHQSLLNNADEVELGGPLFDHLLHLNALVVVLLQVGRLVHARISRDRVRPLGAPDVVVQEIVTVVRETDIRWVDGVRNFEMGGFSH